MSGMLAVIQEKAQLLSPQRQSELIDFAEFLLSRESAIASVPLGEPAFDWVAESDAEPSPNPSLVNGLVQAEAPPLTRGLTFDWCAGPDDPPVEMTSVEMQHEALEERFEKTQPKMKLNWAGGLRHLRDQYTSVELQHAASKWREESALAYLKDETEK